MGKDHSHYQDRDPSELYLDPPPESAATRRARAPKGSDQAQLRGAYYHPAPPAKQRGLANDPIHGGRARPDGD